MSIPKERDDDAAQRKHRDSLRILVEAGRYPCNRRLRAGSTLQRSLSEIGRAKADAGAFVQLKGMEGVTGMEVVETLPGKAPEPEKHLYEKVIYVIEGLGSTEVWTEEGKKQFFEWGPGSLFSPPLNSWYRLINGGSQPALVAAVTNAPMIVDIFHNLDFIFNCPYQFKDRFMAGSQIRCLRQPQCRSSRSSQRSLRWHLRRATRLHRSSFSF